MYNNQYLISGLGDACDTGLQSLKDQQQLVHYCCQLQPVACTINT